MITSQPPTVSVFEEGNFADSHYDHIVLRKPSASVRRCSPTGLWALTVPHLHLTQPWAWEGEGRKGPPDLEELSFCHQTGKNLSRQQELGRREFGLEDKHIRNSLRKRKETCHDRRSKQISSLLITQRKSQNTKIQPPSPNPSTFTLSGRRWTMGDHNTGLPWRCSLSRG